MSSWKSLCLLSILVGGCDPLGNPQPPSDDQKNCISAFKASQTDATLSASLYGAMSFLFTGAEGADVSAVPQPGVPKGTISPVTIAVVSGTVQAGGTPDVVPLPCTKISVLNHDKDFGSTLTRDNGRFDMAVNGTATYTLLFEHPGYLPVHREILALSQDFTYVPKVVMTPLPPEVKTVRFDQLNEWTPVQGAPVTDQHGSRRATLLFAPGTQAFLRRNGKLEAAPALNIRAAEFTQGPAGLAAMPADLPPRSAYTWAAEFMADEALSKDVSAVEFQGRPVYTYVDNFLSYPVGSDVPAGYYDRQSARWVPSDNGRVIRILAIRDGIAVLDVRGREQEASEQLLERLGISLEERRALAGLFQPPKSLWRVPISHFTPWDYNWPFGPPTDAAYPPQARDPRDVLGEEQGVCTERPDASQIDVSGGDVTAQLECGTRVLNMRMGLGGTPFNLVYSSRRVPGYLVARSLNIPLKGVSMPASLQAVEVNVGLAGNPDFFTRRYGPTDTPSLVATPVWDGLSAFQQQVGSWTAQVNVAYVYNGQVYTSTDEQKRLFGSYPTDVDAIRRVLPDGKIDTREAVRYYTRYRVPMEVGTNLGLGLLGLGLDIHHRYDPRTRRVHLGDGRILDLKTQIPYRVQTVAGKGVPGKDDGGGDPLRASLNAPRGLALDQGQNLYIADTDGQQVFRLGLIAGGFGRVVGGTRGYTLNPEPADGAGMLAPQGLALDDKGQLYVADPGTTYNRVRVVKGPTFYLLAGNMEKSDHPGPAHPVMAPMGGPSGIVALPHRTNPKMLTLYIAETGNHRVRRLDVSKDTPSGRTEDPSTWKFDMNDLPGSEIAMRSVVGTGTPGYKDGAAGQAQLRSPVGLTVSPDRSVLYIADRDNHAVRAVNISNDNPTTWQVTTVAGTGSEGFQGDGGAGTAALLRRPSAVATVGTYLIIADTGNHRIRRVQLAKGLPNTGYIDTIAGTGAGMAAGCPAGRSALDTDLVSPEAVVAESSGDIYVADTGNHCVRKLFWPEALPRDENNLQLRTFPHTVDGKLLYYVFAGPQPPKGHEGHEGRHIKTLDDQFQNLYVFDYTGDALSTVTRVLDPVAKPPKIEVTTITQKGADLVEIVAPSGTATELKVTAGSAGKLKMAEEISAGGGAKVWSLAYERDTGLLKNLKDTAGKVHEITFATDRSGRLSRYKDGSNTGHDLTPR